MGSNSTLFLQYQTLGDRLWALWAKRKLFTFPHRIFLDIDLTRSHVVKLQKPREQVVVARKPTNGQLLKILGRSLEIPSPPGGRIGTLQIMPSHGQWWDLEDLRWMLELKHFLWSSPSSIYNALEPSDILFFTKIYVGPTKPIPNHLRYHCLSVRR